LEPEIHSFFRMVIEKEKDPLAVVEAFAGYFVRKARATFVWNKLSDSEKKKLVREAAALTERFRK
jgi:hypothetical protein